MFSLKRTTVDDDRSFLPEDYVARRNETRTNLLAVSLFAIVTFGVIAAFLVTSRQWHDVKRHQESINVRYAQAAKDIEQLKQLEERRESLLQKAELTTALIERVPRSILLAELINRMPRDVTLLEMEVKSTRVAEPPPPTAAAGKDKAAAKAKASSSDKTARKGATDKPEAPKVTIAPPRFKTGVVLVGVTSTHNSVAQFVAELQTCELLSDVELKFSEKAVIESQELNRFRVEATIKPNADARRIEALHAGRNKQEGMQNPMSFRNGQMKQAGPVAPEEPSAAGNSHVTVEAPDADHPQEER